MLISLLLSCLFLVAHSGNISPQDIVISPNNKNTASQITLIFTLETSLASTDYLRIIFPFRLNSLQSGGWQAYVNCSTAGPDNLAVVTASTLASDTNAYFVQFYTDATQTTLSGLSANVTYYLKVNGVPDSSSQTGINLPVELYTVSNNQQDNWIVYDSNPAFGVITLADPFPSTMTVVRTIPSTEVNKNVLGATYKVNIDITPKTTLKDRARIDISLTNSAFSLLSCQSLNSTSEKIPLLSGTFTALNAYTIRATIAQTLTAGNGAKYRFQCQVRNPALPGTSRVSVYNRYGYIETIIESGTESQGLQASVTSGSGTSGWDETSHQILLGWGYPASSPTALGIFSLYKDASTSERWYQSATTLFKPKVDMTTTQMLQVVISTVNDAGFKLLLASISHNLPDYSGTAKVACSVLTQGYLTCQNVGQLQATSYYVSFKFNLVSTTTATSVADFGKVSVQTQATSPVVLLSLSLTTLTNKAIATNVALYPASTNGVIASSTTSSSVTTTYVTNEAGLTLAFGFKYFTSNIIPLATTTFDMGIEFYTSTALPTATNPSCNLKVSGSAFSLTTDVTISDCAVESLTASSFTRLRFRIAKFVTVAGGSKPATLFQTTAQAGAVTFTNCDFTGLYSSLNYVNANVFDYYARWVQGFTASSPTIVTNANSAPFFFNSLVYTNGGLGSVNVGTTFFTTGATTADPANDGTNFPTLIRITGQLLNAEQATADRLVLFFNDLTPLVPTNPCFGPTGISCTYNVNGIDNTQTDSLTDYSGSRQIIINTDLTQAFNIYIPVATTASKQTIGFFLTTAKIVSTSATSQNIFATKYSKRVGQVVYTSTSITVNAANPGSTPQMSIPGGTAMGATISTTIQNVGSSYTPASPNSGTAIGAAYGYCANYDFTTSSSFHLQYFPTPVTAATACVTMKYNPSVSKTVTCNICPVHSTMSSTTLTATSFTMPSLAGVDFYNLLYVASENTGNFKNAAYDNQANVLTAFTLSSVALTFTPTYFKKGSNNIYASITFTAISALPASIQINLTPGGSSTSLFMTPVTAVSCQVTTLTASSCTTSGTSSSIQINVVASGTGWPSGTAHTIQFMVNNNAASVSGNTTVNYNMNIKVTGTTSLPSAGAIHHQTSTTNTYTVTDVAQEYIVLSNITYLFGNKNARSMITFAFELPDDIIVYSQQTIVFNLGGISSANSGESPVCIIRDPTTLEVSNDFGVCDISDLTQLTLQPKTSASGAYILELGYIKIPSSAAPTGISCQVIAIDGATIVSQSDPVNLLALPTAPASTLIPALNVNFQRLYADPGSISEIVLQVQPSVSAIGLQSCLYLYFPNYYPGNLGYENIWCTANDLPVSCFILAQRIMQLTSFPVDVNTSSSVTLKIYGIITPVVPVPAGKIFIGLDSDADMFTLTEQLEISDGASNSATPNALWLDGFSVSTNLIRQKADHTYYFTTDAIGVRANKMICFNYPDRYGSILRGIDGPVIAISKTNSTTVTEVQSVAFGSRFKILLPLNLDPLTSYKFVIEDLDNPDYETCKMDRPVISVTDTTQVAASSTSAPNVWNAASVSYVSNPSLKTLTWADASGNAITSLTLSIGIFSKIIKILPPTGENFNNDLTFTISQTDISILPSTLTATRGSPYLTLEIGASSSSFPRILLLGFTKEESTTTTIYQELPKLEVILTNNKQVLPVPSLRLMQGGTSLPYQWQLDTLGFIPYSELKITCSINQPTLSDLSIIGASVITFGPTAPQQAFTFVLTGTADPTNPPSFVLSIGGDDAANYMFVNNTVTVEVLLAVATAPQLLSLTVTANYGPTTQEFILTTDQVSAVYWHVAYENDLSTTDCSRVVARYAVGNLYESSSTNQAQYGVFYVYQENAASSQVIGNLLSNQAYSYILCPVNQLDSMGTSTTGTFTTQDNGALLDQVNIQFSQTITRNQLTSLVCLFNSELQLPNLNVVAMDGTSCSTASTFDDFSSFNYNTVIIYVYGDRSSQFTSITSSLLNDFVTSVQTQTPSDFLTAFNQALKAASLTNLYQSITLQVGPTYPLPVIDTTSTVTAISTDTTIIITGLKLSSGEGVFYAVASTDLVNAPTPLQIQAQTDYSAATVSGANVIFSSSAVSLTLTDLTPNTTYMVYYYASNGDRTQYARVTDVAYIQSTTEKAKTVGGVRMEVKIMFTIIFAIVSWLL